MTTVAACVGAIAAEAVARAMADANRMFFMDIPGLERTQANPWKGQTFLLHKKFSLA
jgi:hypothetical protein